MRTRSAGAQVDRNQKAARGRCNRLEFHDADTGLLGGSLLYLIYDDQFRR